MVKTFCVIFCACQCQFERKKWNFELLWFFCEILSRLRKTFEVMLAFGELLEAHFGAPKNGKSRRYRHHYTPIRCIFSYCFFALFFIYFFSEISKKSVPPSLYADQVRTCCIKKAFYALALSFVICDFCETRIAYGGVVRPETLRTAPHRRIVMAVAFKKNRWDKQKSVP